MTTNHHRVSIHGDNDRVPTVDASTHAINTIDYSHHEIHAGSHFFAIYSLLRNTAEIIEVRIQTPDTTKWAHMTFDIECALAATVELWAATTKTHVTGNAIVGLNRDFNSSTASGLTICHTPAGTQSGAADLLEYVGAAATGGRVAVGGEATSNAEFILKQNTAYLVRATSRADGNALAIILDWYEHTNLE